METVERQPKALYYAIAVNIWEYFSYYGMRLLYLVKKYQRS